MVDIVKVDAEPAKRAIKRRFKDMTDGTYAEVVVLANQDSMVSTDASGNTTVSGSITTSTGNLEVAKAGNGLYLKSPNGQRWLVTINNSGVLTAAAA